MRSPLPHAIRLLLWLWLLLREIYAQTPCDSLPAGTGEQGLTLTSPCSLPAPDGSTCTLACTNNTLNSQAFIASPSNHSAGVNETFIATCSNGIWNWTGVGVDPTIGPYCLLYHDVSKDYTGVTVYLTAFTGNFSITNNQSSMTFLRRETFFGPKVYPPYDLAIRVTVNALTTWGDYVRVTLTDKIGILGSIEADAESTPNGVANEYFCYSTETFDNYDQCCSQSELPFLSTDVDSYFYRWWEYSIDIVGSLTAGGLFPDINYQIVVEFIDGHIIVGADSPPKSLFVNPQDVTIAYFDSPYFSEEYISMPVEITFVGKELINTHPVIVIVGDAQGSLCASTAGSSLFQNILTIGTAGSNINQASNISYKTVTTFGKFILTPTSAPPLRPYDVEKKTGKYFIAIYSPDGAADTTFFNLTINYGPDFKSQRVSAFAFILIFPLVISIAYLANVYFLVGVRICGKFHCSLYPLPYIGLTRYRRPMDYWRSILFTKTARPFSYSWLTCIVACVFGVASYQVVISTWTDMHTHGNTDLCFYNEKCYRPLSTWHIPFNNIISNMAYVIVGIGFVINVGLVESRERAGHDHSTMYALGFAIIGEGIFSGLYHICPSPNIFQFDTAFMYLMSALMMIAVFQTSEEEIDESIPHRMKAAKVFLFFYSPILIFNYIGTTIDRDQDLNNPVAFWMAVVIWEILGFAGLALSVERPRELVKREDWFIQHFRTQWKREIIAFLIGPFIFWCIVAITICVTIWNAISRTIPIASMFLYLTLGISQFMVFRIGIFRADWGHGRAMLLVFLIVVTLTSIVISLSYFALPVSDKTLAPSASRALNSDCSVFGYFDSHDVWHIACAIGLGCAFVLCLNLNPPENETKQIFPQTQRSVEAYSGLLSKKKPTHNTNSQSVSIEIVRSQSSPPTPGSVSKTGRSESMDVGIGLVGGVEGKEKLSKIEESRTSEESEIISAQDLTTTPNK